MQLYFRGDAAFASPEIYEYLEAEGFRLSIRLPGNQIPQEGIGYLLTRPVGRPPNHVRRYYASFSYRAGSWERKRRVVAKVAWQPGELHPPRRLHRHQPVPTRRTGGGQPLCRHDGGPSRCIKTIRQDGSMPRSSECALLMQNGHVAGLLIAKSARSRAGHSLSNQCRAGFAAACPLCCRCRRLAGFIWGIPV